MTFLEEILGTSWALETYQSEDKWGQVLYPLGETAKGVIVFTKEQRLAVQIMAADRQDKRAAANRPLFNTETEKEMAQIGYHAYSGPFEWDAKKKQLITQVDLSLLAAYVGTKQTRAAKIEGDRLYLSNVQHPERRLVWKKIKKE